MKCQKCRNEMVEGKSFCPNCGEKQTIEKSATLSGSNTLERKISKWKTTCILIFTALMLVLVLASFSDIWGNPAVSLFYTIGLRQTTIETSITKPVAEGGYKVPQRQKRDINGRIIATPEPVKPATTMSSIERSNNNGFIMYSTIFGFLMLLVYLIGRYSIMNPDNEVA